MLADAKGVVASLAQLLFGFNCNIVQSDQFSDESLKPSRFFQVSLQWPGRMVSML
jgi:formyltetrahydrofolate hydrolase